MTIATLISIEVFLESHKDESFRKTILSRELGINYYTLRDNIKYLIANKKVTEKKGLVQWSAK